MKFVDTKKLFRNFWILSFVCAGITSSQSSQPAKTCLIRQAVFDLGSESTKLKVLETDICRGRIVTLQLLDALEKISYKTDLVNSKESQFSPEIKKAGLEALKRLKTQALSTGAQNFVGVATSAFRDAKNGEAFVNEIKDAIGLQVRIVSQEEEGRLGYWAVQSVPAYQTADIKVWDIGGGSLQISYREGIKPLKMLRSQMGSVVFKNKVLKEILKKEASVQSPNPLSKQDISRALVLAERIARENQIAFQSKGNQLPLVIGIGKVHSRSIIERLGFDPNKIEYPFIFTQKDLTRALEKNTGLTDAEIGGKYAETDITNMILVLGFMKALQIERVTVLNVGLAEGLVANPDYWRD